MKTILALVLALSLVAAPGCQLFQPQGLPGQVQQSPPLTPLGRVDVARQSNVAMLQIINPLIEARIIRGRATLEMMAKAKKQILIDLDAAEAHARAGGEAFTFEFLLSRAVTAIANMKTEGESRQAGRTPAIQVQP